MIDLTALKKGMRTELFGRKVYAFDSIDSTNACARIMASAGAPEGTLVVADFQTSGRGRMGRPWIAPPGENLLLSLVVRPPAISEGTNLLPLLAAVAVARAVQQVTGLSPDCKWPNDLFLNGKKFCGILLEGSIREAGVDFVVVGIGINVNQTDFPTDLSGQATSLRLATGSTVPRERLLQKLLEQFEILYRESAKGRFQDVPRLWESHSGMLGRSVSIVGTQGTFDGTAEGIAGDGGLIIATPAGTRVVYAGDVTLRGFGPPDLLNAPRS